MTQLRPFTDFFVEEALKRMSHTKVLDSDINRACFAISQHPINIAPPLLEAGGMPFEFTNPTFLYVYPSKKDSEEYLLKSEQLVEAMHGIKGQAVFEIRGNKSGIVFSFYAEEPDIEIIERAVSNFYPNAVTEIGSPYSVDGEYIVNDFLPNAPFWKAHSTFHEFVLSPLNIIPNLLQEVEQDEGVYQVLFTPLPGEFHELVEDSIDSEWTAKHGADNKATPSIQSGAINRKLEYKSPDFRSYFSVCARFIIPKGTNDATVQAFISSYLYGSMRYPEFRGHFRLVHYSLGR